MDLDAMSRVQFKGQVADHVYVDLADAQADGQERRGKARDAVMQAQRTGKRSTRAQELLRLEQRMKPLAPACEDRTSAVEERQRDALVQCIEIA